MIYKIAVDASASSLASGRALVPGETIDLSSEEVTENEQLIEDRQLIEFPEADADGSYDELAGDALQQRARELDIQGRSQMNADDLRTAIRLKEEDNAKAESEAAAAEQDHNDDDDEEGSA